MTNNNDQFVYPQNEHREFSQNLILNNSSDYFCDPTILDFKKEEYIKNFEGAQNLEFVLDFNNNVHSFSAEYIGHEDNIYDNPARGLLVKEQNFKYFYNKHGFRSKDFDKFSKNNFNILVSGCSITFGHGLPQELTWPCMLEEKIKKYVTNNDVDLYNLGSCGASTLTIIKNIITFINLYGKPDVLFVLFTEMARSFIYEELKNKYEQAIYREDLFYMSKKYAKNKWARSFVYENNLIINSTLIHILESFCKNSGIKLIWSSWVSKESEYFKNFNFKNFIEIEKFETLLLHPEIIDENDDENMKKAKEEFIENFRKRNLKNLPYWEHARDLQHPGTCFSESVSNSFLQKWMNND